MSTLVFSGAITDGAGRHVELHVPGRDEIAQAPPDWPKNLQKGSLNVRIAPNGYPPLFAEHELPMLVRSLDARVIEPAFEIEQHRFGNNKLAPTLEMPRRGSAQVWRAQLLSGELTVRCWVLRRYGSGLHDQLELLSAIHMRDTYRLVTGQVVTVTLERGDAQQVVPADGPRPAVSSRR